MSATDDKRCMTDGDFWDQAALDALQGFASNPNESGAPIQRFAKGAAEAADALLAERRKRQEGGGT